MTTREILSAWEDSSLETEHSGFLLGAGHTGVLCLEHTNFLDSQKESWCSADWFRPDRSLGTGSSSYWSGLLGTILKSRFPGGPFQGEQSACC